MFGYIARQGSLQREAMKTRMLRVVSVRKGGRCVEGSDFQVAGVSALYRRPTSYD